MAASLTTKPTVIVIQEPVRTKPPRYLSRLQKQYTVIWLPSFDAFLQAQSTLTPDHVAAVFVSRLDGLGNDVLAVLAGDSNGWKAVRTIGVCVDIVDRYRWQDSPTKPKLILSEQDIGPDCIATNSEEPIRLRRHKKR